MTVTSVATPTASTAYPIPKGLQVIPLDELDLRSDTEVDHVINNPGPVTSAKNIWFFWNSGYENVHPYANRNIRAWHRRLSRKGWTMRVMDLEPESPGYIGNWIDLQDPDVVPEAFRAGTLDGEFAKQHYSDLVRFPLLLKYGGAYVDVGYMQIGDLDRLWNETIANPDSPYEVLSFNLGGPREYSLTNYFIASLPGNVMWQACHELLLKLWEGRTNTHGLHSHPLLKGLPMMGKTFNQPGLSERLTDYILQGQAITMVLNTVDQERGWDGPEYVSTKVFAPDYMVATQLINEHTSWNGVRAFELLSQKIAEPGHPESADQKLAREIVEDCLKRSFGFKLAHGIIVQVLGETLGTMWRKNVGSDNVEGTYAHWLRYGIERWIQNYLPEGEAYEKVEPIKRGPLLKEA